MLIFFFLYNKLYCQIYIVKVKSDNSNSRIVYGHTQKLYEDEFEGPYLENIREYYKKESENLINSISVEQYVSRVCIS